tara:strand:+ start:544 stop:2568 length:2025 start_codon:yes stop_codon:yes gene_type:complete
MTDPGLLVLAGGGHSHALVLKRWAMQPHRRPKRSILLINRCSTALYSGMVPGFIAGLYKRDELAIDLRTLSENAGVAFARAEIIGVNPTEKLLHLQGRPSLRYSLLSLDVGAVSPLNAQGIPIKPLEPALAFLAQQLPDEKLPFRVIGAGAAGVEVVLALRQRWPKRQLQLQMRQTQLPDEIEKILGECNIKLITNTEPWSGPSLLCTGSLGPKWLRDSGLPVNREGRVQTDNSLRVEGVEGIFASGDCAVIRGTNRPASGVWAVRAAKPLSQNLEASCRGDSLRQWRPQRHALQIVGTSQGTAWAQWWRWKSPATSALWKWKQRIDRQFMTGFTSSDMTQKELMGCRGCAAKVPAEPLRAALKRVNLGGRVEDAAELTRGKTVWLQSMDGFPALVSDPWLNGRLTTLHACSDLWASGANVRSAMATISLPMISGEEQQEWLVQTLAGIKSVLDEQGASLLGGHTMEARSSPPSTTSLGIQTILTINGTTNRHWHKSGMRPGDVLLISRPLGTGVLFAGAMIGETAPGYLDEALQKMNQSQHMLIEDIKILGSAIHACTDITGFGLLGHLGEMLAGSSELTVQIDSHAIPTYNGAMPLLKRGIKSTMAPYNQRAWELLGKKIEVDTKESKSLLDLLVDPQTCGPLLIACEPNTAQILIARETWTQIGTVARKAG